jgi:hypothetical protein
MTQRGEWQRRAMAALGYWLAQRGSRQGNVIDRLARRVLERLLRFDFHLEERVRLDRGYDPEELERYQRKESKS